MASKKPPIVDALFYEKKEKKSSKNYLFALRSHSQETCVSIKIKITVFFNLFFFFFSRPQQIICRRENECLHGRCKKKKKKRGEYYSPKTREKIKGILFCVIFRKTYAKREKGEKEIGFHFLLFLLNFLMFLFVQ